MVDSAVHNAYLNRQGRDLMLRAGNVTKQIQTSQLLCRVLKNVNQVMKR